MQPLPIARALARRLVTRRPTHALPWRWDASMGVLGLAHVMDACPRARARHLNDLCDYQRTHLRTPRIALSDHCLGAQTSLRLLRCCEDAEARFAADRVVAYLRTAPENDLGVLDHLGRHAWVRHFMRPGIWVDSMMMYVLTAAQLGRSMAEPWLTRFAVRHAEAYCRQLQGPHGLFRHAKLFPDRRAPVYWLRGNGWAAACLVELCRASPLLADAFERQAAMLLESQAGNGLWPTIVDAPTSPHETSGTAMVAYALAVGARRGVLPPAARAAAWRAWRGLCSRLTATRDGLTLRGISAPSIPAPPLVYRWTPRLAGLSYGVGAMMMLGADLSREVRSGDCP